MRRVINNIARYIIGVWGLVLLFLLACVFNEENIVADKLIIFASVIFVGVTIILFVTYFIHLFWMIQEKRKPQDLKSDIIFLIVLVLTLSAYDIYAGRFVWEDIWKKFILVILIILSSEIGKYIYSWRE